MESESAFLKIYNYENKPELCTVNKNEIMRYAGMLGANEDFSMQVLDSCIKEALDVSTYRVSYAVYCHDDNSDKAFSGLPFDAATSTNLMKNLNGCSKTVMFAATIGAAIDRLITRYSRISPVKALFFQAIGAERIEKLCDVFCDDIAKGNIENLKSDCGYITHPRFSPGYGDLPLSVQKDFFRVLDCNRKLGLTLNDSLLMSPSKSVTAIVGIENKCTHSGGGNDDVKYERQLHNCDECSLLGCEYRKEK